MEAEYSEAYAALKEHEDRVSGVNAPSVGGGNSRPKRKSSGSAAGTAAGAAAGDDSGSDSEFSHASKRRAAPNLSAIEIIKRLPEGSRAALVTGKHITPTGAVIPPPKPMQEWTYLDFTDGFGKDQSAADTAFLQLKRFNVIERDAPAAIKEEEEENEEEESKSQEGRAGAASAGAASAGAASAIASKPKPKVWKLKKKDGGGGT